jgi:hypothetical protein
VSNAESVLVENGDGRGAVKARWSFKAISQEDTWRRSTVPDSEIPLPLRVSSTEKLVEEMQPIGHELDTDGSPSRMSMRTPRLLSMAEFPNASLLSDIFTQVAGEVTTYNGLLCEFQSRSCFAN